MNKKQYIASYIRQSLQESTLNAPDKSRGSDELDVLESLYRAHQKGGPEATKQIWENMIKHSPEKARLIEKETAKLLYHIDELDSIPPIKWIIPNLIATQSLNEIHGAPNAGKSLYALDISLKLAMDSPVTYVAAEGLIGQPPRINAWTTQNGQKPTNFYVYRQAVNLLDKAQVLNFLEVIREKKPVLIVFDTLARCMSGGDENSARDMGMVIENCDLLRTQLKSSILLIHHTGKNSSDERGSSALRGACDTMIHIQNENNIITIKNVKQKEAKLFKDIQKAIVEVDHSVVVVDVTDDILHQSKFGQNEIDILTTMNTTIYQTSGVTNAIIEENTGISGGTLTRALSRLKQQGYISQSATRKPYFITPEGQTILQNLN